MSQPQRADKKLPSLGEATEWLNRATADNPEKNGLETNGYPTLIHFWSISSEESKTNLAQVAQLRDLRKRDGLRVFAVHLPQSEAEKDSRPVRDAIARLHITEPCALDNDERLRKAFAVQPDDLPVYYLFDAEENLRGCATGANGLEAIEDQLDEMIAGLRDAFPFCPACERFLNKDSVDRKSVV